MTFGPGARHLLNDRHRQALDAASTIVVDELLDDLDAVSEGAIRGKAPTLNLKAHLPAESRDRVDTTFVRKVLVCAVVVGLKQRLPYGDHRLACPGEVFALRYLARVAAGYGTRIELWDDHDSDELGRYVDVVTEGVDARLPDVDEWFEPFDDTHPVHPACEDED
jgi:hypothetical protein